MGRDEDWERSVIEPARSRRRHHRVARARRRRLRLLAAAASLIALVVIVVAETGGSGDGPAGRLSRDGGAKAGPRSTAASVSRVRRAAHEREGRTIDRILSYTSFVSKGVPRKREVALTFDDGPGPYTPKILRLLRHRHAHATFFEVGAMLAYFHGSTRRQLRDGDAIGDHTMNHPHMGQLAPETQRSELIDQAAALRSYGAPAPRLFRPPYGSFDLDTLRLLRRERMLMVLWSTDTQDYAEPGSDVIAERALAGAHPGAIILLHDGGGDRSETVEAIPKIVRGIRARHLRLVTVPRLLLDDPPPHHQAVPWDLGGSGS